jgi:BirA family biotin operon repressor/biotin-[acetyl-CoA-carboxylase] ligase
LDAAKIKAKLANGSVNLKFFEIIDSTNKYALEQTDTGKPLVCLAEYQTAGRGRQEHRWISPYASGLCLSIKYNYKTLNGLEGLSIALAVTIAQVLFNLGIVEIGLKWPNDLLWKQRKLGGLLLESRCSKKYEVVMGLGINIKMPVVSDISQPWVDLNSILEQPPTRNFLAANLINNCLSTLTVYPDIGLEPFLHNWKRFDLSYKKLITLQIDNKIVKGVANGIDRQGALKVNNQSYISGSLLFV